jgi:hypothetical protein
MAEIGPNWNNASSIADTANTQSLFTARGGAGSFDNNKYSIDQLQYPSDLMGSLAEYGNNYVIFYINIASDSKLLKEGAAETVEDSTPRDYGDVTALSNKYGGTAGVAVGGTALSAGVGGLVAQAGIKSFATIGGAAIGADLALKQVGSTFSGQKKRLSTAIALHAPNTMQTTYSINYEEEDLDIYAMGLAAAGGGSALAKAAISKGTASNVMSDILRNSNVVSGVVAAGLKISGTGGISRLTGLAPNPRKEQLFKNVQFRTFTFDYQFYPRDASEAANVENIIYQFKLHMHPEFKDANNFLYVYPSEFDIFYYHGIEENLHVNRHTSCVLTDMVVNYTPNGQFTSFSNGMPTQINVTLTFKELATLTKEKIQDKL